MKKIIITVVIALSTLYTLAHADGLGMSKPNWEKDHFVTEWPVIGVGTSYDGKYNVSFTWAPDIYVESFKIDPLAVNRIMDFDIILHDLTPPDRILVKQRCAGGDLYRTYFSETLKNRVEDGSGYFMVYISTGSNSGKLTAFNIYLK